MDGSKRFLVWGPRERVEIPLASKLNLRENKERTELLWKSAELEGVDKLLDYLSSSDYYTAPCSVRHHLDIEGGLAYHSMIVFDELRDLVEMHYPELKIPASSVVVCALGHDLCKINCYKPGGEGITPAQAPYLQTLVSKIFMANLSRLTSTKVCAPNGKLILENISKDYASALINWAKETSQPFPERQVEWSWNEELPMGHGGKSAYILGQFIKLKPEEALAITWHMGAYTANSYEWKSMDAAFALHPLVPLLHISDMLASHVTEAFCLGDEGGK